jgi:hypothetical protein
MIRFHHQFLVSKQSDLAGIKGTVRAAAKRARTVWFGLRCERRA